MTLLQQQPISSQTLNSCCGAQGNEARYINHSCDPNCETFSAPSESGLRVIICARRDIEVGQELTINYRLCEIQVNAAQKTCCSRAVGLGFVAVCACALTCDCSLLTGPTNST